MASSEGSFPSADAEAELNPGMGKDFQVDPISANVAISKEKEEAKALKRLKEQEKKDAVQSFKTAIIVSGIVVAVAGAVFAIAKKLRESK